MPTRKYSRTPEICVVGAGLAGLRCADILLQHGFKVTILEARDRIGGRAHQEALPSGHLVDLGPNWIHGTDHNPILDLAKATKTEMHTWGEQLRVFGEDGELLKEGREISDVMWKIIAQAFKYSAQNASTIDPNESLKDFFEKNVLDEFPGEKHSDKKKILMQMAELWGAFVGSPVYRQSLKFFWLEECIDGAENLFAAGTYKDILAKIAAPALADANIQLSTKVIQIKSCSDVISISTDNGRTLDFDDVVVTTPLGWLKKNKHVFDPPLSAVFSSAIDSIGYGSLDKVYLTFPRAFWLDNPDNQKFTGFIQWLAPQYAKDTNPARWNQEVVDLSTLPGSCAHPTLLFYTYGDQSVVMANELASRASQDERDKYLVEFFKPYVSRLPNYEGDSKDCTPISCLATTWVLDEFAGNGSYTTLRTGLLEGDRDIETMRDGLPDRHIWFAGEHTAPFVALGTSTGAYWSGEAIGLRIADVYGNTVSGH
ncbi:FAD/NAD(P)-binding domain-containing protein [Stipitochalara longipes BDJ]|nr:FAD/NAD(P)-binding domain-containing protein [Stipitochalara longipes BDJ]